MHKTKQLLLLGVAGVVILAGLGSYYFSAEPPQSLPPERAAKSAEAGRGGVDDVQMLLKANGCLGCHASDKKLVGPAYRDVAARYKGDERAVEKVTASILHGGAERWGDVPMPASRNLTDAQAAQLAEYVLQQ